MSEAALRRITSGVVFEIEMNRRSNLNGNQKKNIGKLTREIFWPNSKESGPTYTALQKAEPRAISPDTLSSG